MAANKTLPEKPYFRVKLDFLTRKLECDPQSLDELRRYPDVFPEVDMALSYYGLDRTERKTLKQVAAQFGFTASRADQQVSQKINGVLLYLGSQSIQSQAAASVAREIRRKITKLRTEAGVKNEQRRLRRNWLERIRYYGLTESLLPEGLDPSRLPIFARVYRLYNDQELRIRLDDERLVDIIVSRFGLDSAKCVSCESLSTYHQITRQRVGQLEAKALRQLGLIT